MKKVYASVLLLAAAFCVNNATAATNWHHGFERRENNRGFEFRGYHNFHDEPGYSNYYDRRYYYHPQVVYNTAPVVAYDAYQYGPRRMGYYFYPGINVYFNPINHLYIYPSRGVWVTAPILPRGLVINEPFRQVYCGVGENIWAYNRVHVNTYRRAPIYVERSYGAERFREREAFRDRR